MNKVILIGNLTKDPELRNTQGGKAVCSFTVACQRKIANANGVREADFINCVAWEKTGEFIHKYFIKGNKIAIEGRMQVRSYEAQDGSKRIATDVVVDSAEFCAAKGEGHEANAAAPSANHARQSDPAEQYAVKDEAGTDDLPF